MEKVRGKGGEHYVMRTVTVIMIHLCQHVDSIRVKREIWISHYSKSVKLMTECSLAKHELSGIRTVQTVHTVYTTYTILQKNVISPRRNISVSAGHRIGA